MEPMKIGNALAVAGVSRNTFNSWSRRGYSLPANTGSDAVAIAAFAAATKAGAALADARVLIRHALPGAMRMYRDRIAYPVFAAVSFHSNTFNIASGRPADLAHLFEGMSAGRVVAVEMHELVNACRRRAEAAGLPFEHYSAAGRAMWERASKLMSRPIMESTNAAE